MRKRKINDQKENNIHRVDRTWIENGIYQIAWGFKSLVLVQPSQIQNIFRFDKCLGVAFCMGNGPKIWKMKINCEKAFFAINRSK
jgi:hypothetical protein